MSQEDIGEILEVDKSQINKLHEKAYLAPHQDGCQQVSCRRCPFIGRRELQIEICVFVLFHNGMCFSRLLGFNWSAWNWDKQATSSHMLSTTNLGPCWCFVVKWCEWWNWLFLLLNSSTCPDFEDASSRVGSWFTSSRDTHPRRVDSSQVCLFAFPGK